MTVKKHTPTILNLAAISAGDFTPSSRERFLDKVERLGPDDCWPWKAARDADGYGQFNIGNGVMRRAHRIAFALSNGSTPSDRLVCHTCDNPPCCNPAHHFLGTIQDNQFDMAVKGRGTSGDKNTSRMNPEKVQRGDEHYSIRTPERMVRGESHGMAKLTEIDVRQIRADYRSRALNRLQLATKYNVSPATIHRTVTGKNWAHIAA